MRKKWMEIPSAPLPWHPSTAWRGAMMWRAKHHKWVLVRYWGHWYNIERAHAPIVHAKQIVWQHRNEHWLPGFLEQGLVFFQHRFWFFLLFFPGNISGQLVVVASHTQKLAQSCCFLLTVYCCGFPRTRAIILISPLSHVSLSMGTMAIIPKRKFFIA